MRGIPLNVHFNNLYISPDRLAFVTTAPAVAVVTNCFTPLQTLSTVVRLFLFTKSSLSAKVFAEIGLMCQAFILVVCIPAIISM